MNTLAKVGLGLLAAFGIYKGYKAFSTKKMSEKLNVEVVNPRVHDVKFDGIVLRTDVRLQNPTKGQMTLTQPYVKLFSTGEMIASSKVENKQFVIKPMSEIMLDPISIKVDWTEVLKLLMRVKFEWPDKSTLLQKITYLMSNYEKILGKLNLSIQYSTYANGFYFESEPENII
jgi:hypothetical protein